MTELTRGIDLHPGDCLDVLATLPCDHFDSCVCDPPYHLTTGKNGGTGEASLNLNSPAGRARISTGFMGTAWDGGDIAFRPDVWRAVLRVLKPGAHLLAMGGTRTYHRLACAIEDAGFEIRDQLAWVTGQGFPKSRNIGNGWGTALKPAWEPIVLARKPLGEATIAANVLRWGTGALNIDGCRIETAEDLNGGAYADVGGRSESQSLHGGTGMNVAGKTVGAPYLQPSGRWPANIVHDGSEEVLAAFPDLGKSTGGRIANISKTSAIYGGGNGLGQNLDPNEVRGDPGFGDTGSAARFFYTAKAGLDDRLGSRHPTIKPVDLMQWLCRLVTPRGGLVLDPFAGTGTTGEAAWREGMRAVLIEREAEYQADIRRRMALMLVSTAERRRQAHKEKQTRQPLDHQGTLFE
jgi:site-specific DNA-methyltransferase (adenine-specific)